MRGDGTSFARHVKGSSASVGSSTRNNAKVGGFEGRLDGVDIVHREARYVEHTCIAPRHLRA